MSLLNVARNSPTNQLWNKLIWDCNKKNNNSEGTERSPWKITALKVLNASALPFQFLATCALALFDHTFGTLFRLARSINDKKSTNASRQEPAENVQVPPSILNPNAANSNGDTNLHLAIQQGNTDEVQALIQASADINAANSNGETPLHLAARQGNTEVVQALLNHRNIDVNAEDNISRTPLHFAEGNTVVLETLIQAGANVNALLDMIIFSFQSSSAIQKLLQLLKDNNININDKNSKGLTLLHLAVLHNSSNDVIQALLNEDADINVRDDDNLTPLHHAVMKFNVNVVEVLLKNNADINAANTDNDTPYELALYFKENECYLNENQKANLPTIIQLLENKQK